MFSVVKVLKDKSIEKREKHKEEVKVQEYKTRRDKATTIKKERTSVVNEYDHYEGYGFIHYEELSNGITIQTVYSRCHNCMGSGLCGLCHGTGKCNICNGQGYVISAGYGNYYPCYSCQYGECSSCKGNKNCICVKSGHPGYQISSFTAVYKDGTILYHDKYKMSIDEPQKVKCPKCRGKKYDPEPFMYVLDNPPGWAHNYYNINCKCPYCGLLTEHYHYPCTECFGKGKVSLY